MFENELRHLAEEIGQLLMAKKQVVTLAESCTGGLVSALITEVPGSSAWFDSGLVVYSNQAKQDLLKVQASTLDQFGAVSEEVAAEMAIGALNQGRADIAAANLRRENALLAVKALEVQIANDIDTGLHMRASALERWQQWQEVARREQQQLDLERKRFAAGRSEMREILMREEKSVNSRLMALEQQVAFAKAQVILESAQGILLKRWHS